MVEKKKAINNVSLLCCLFYIAMFVCLSVRCETRSETDRVWSSSFIAALKQTKQKQKIKNKPQAQPSYIVSQATFHTKPRAQPNHKVGHAAVHTKL